MRWEGREQSTNVVDRRGGPRGPKAMGGGAIVLVLVLLAMKFLNVSPEVQNVVQNAGEAMVNSRVDGAREDGGGVDDQYREFIGVILKDTENVWNARFREELGTLYEEPRLEMFQEYTQSRCGEASSEMGPFYCPADEQIYIDPTFFEELAKRHKAGGDFAAAYVIAHEVAHHVQNLLGDNRVVHAARASGDTAEANQMSVRLELQADFLAGVWAHHLERQYKVLEEGDVEEAIQAAFRIGDDTLQREATGRVRPEHFTHGTSAQRAHWFREG
ncbi:MAG: neutral zinc metallopeptidase, partial [Planctomycetaceae bacterium]|nr:neutral zinc metallopeptidase [Planctomycetaceae bacterium]